MFLLLLLAWQARPSVTHPHPPLKGWENVSGKSLSWRARPCRVRMAASGTSWRGGRGKNTAEQFIKIHSLWRVKHRVREKLRACRFADAHLSLLVFQAGSWKMTSVSTQSEK